MGRESGATDGGNLLTSDERQIGSTTDEPQTNLDVSSPGKKSVLQKVKDTAKKFGSKLKKHKTDKHEDGEEDIDGDDDDVEMVHDNQLHSDSKSSEVPLDEIEMLKGKGANFDKSEEHTSLQDKLSDGLPPNTIGQEEPAVARDESPRGMLQAVPTDYHYSGQPKKSELADEREHGAATNSEQLSGDLSKINEVPVEMENSEQSALEKDGLSGSGVVSEKDKSRDGDEQQSECRGPGALAFEELNSKDPSHFTDSKKNDVEVQTFDEEKNKEKIKNQKNDVEVQAFDEEKNKEKMKNEKNDDELEKKELGVEDLKNVEKKIDDDEMNVDGKVKNDVGDDDFKNVVEGLKKNDDGDEELKSGDGNNVGGDDFKDVPEGLKNNDDVDGELKSGDVFKDLKDVEEGSKKNNDVDGELYEMKNGDEEVKNDVRDEDFKDERLKKNDDRDSEKTQGNGELKGEEILKKGDENDENVEKKDDVGLRKKESDEEVQMNGKKNDDVASSLQQRNISTDGIEAEKKNEGVEKSENIPNEEGYVDAASTMDDGPPSDRKTVGADRTEVVDSTKRDEEDKKPLTQKIKDSIASKLGYGSADDGADKVSVDKVIAEKANEL